MFLEISRFWACKSVKRNDGKFHVEHVMGPDEYHEKYPEASLEDGGLNDNSYTNLMCIWAFETAKRIWDLMSPNAKAALKTKMSFDEKVIFLNQKKK
jgi:trehalose/maltose hydrolase-like predicted phosphorylase